MGLSFVLHLGQGEGQIVWIVEAVDKSSEQRI